MNCIVWIILSNLKIIILLILNIFFILCPIFLQYLLRICKYEPIIQIVFRLNFFYCIAFICKILLNLQNFSILLELQVFICCVQFLLICQVYLDNRWIILFLDNVLSKCKELTTKCKILVFQFFKAVVLRQILFPFNIFLTQSLNINLIFINEIFLANRIIQSRPIEILSWSRICLKSFELLRINYLLLWRIDVVIILKLVEFSFFWWPVFSFIRYPIDHLVLLVLFLNQNIHILILIWHNEI